MKIESIRGSLEIDIPDGWELIETGSIKPGDRYLLGGRYNSIFLESAEWSEPVDFDNPALKITPDMLVIRKQRVIEVNVRVPLYELAGYGKDHWTYQFEHFESFLTEKVSEEIDRELEYFQIVNYYIADHQHDAVIFAVEGYEENE